MITIPAPPANVYRWRQPVRLDNIAMSFIWRWNPRSAIWVLDLLDDQAVLLVTNIPLVSESADLFEPYRYIDLPPGTLRVLSQSRRPGKTAFLDEAKLVYG